MANRNPAALPRPASTSAFQAWPVLAALPPQPFSLRRGIIYGSSQTVLGPTTATLALTDVTFANYFSNGARRLSLVQASAAAPNAVCASPRVRDVVTYGIPSGAQTVVQDFTTPIVLKPLASGDAWCLYASMSAPAADINAAAILTLGGYVLSGTFTP